MEYALIILSRGSKQRLLLVDCRTALIISAFICAIIITPLGLITLPIVQVPLLLIFQLLLLQ